MKSAKGQIGHAVDRPDPNVRFYLFHGADGAGSRALASRLLATLKAEKVSIAGPALKNDPAMLVDEAGAISMFGDKRLIWIEPAGAEIVSALEVLLEAAAVESPVVAIAGTLPRTSALLKLAESHRSALAHTSYLPEGRDADRMVIDLGRAQGLRMGPGVATRIAAAVGNNQALAAQELTKFAIYLGATTDSPRDLGDEVLDLLGADAGDSDVGRIGDLALSGDVARLAEELERLESSGIEPIPAIRALQRRLIQVIALRARMDTGQSAEAVMTSIFWKDKALFQKLLSKWSSPRLAHAMERVGRLEREVLLGAADDEAAMGEELIQIARAASR